MRQEIQDFKDLVKTSISDKTLPGSILKSDVAGRFNGLADLLDWFLDSIGPVKILFQADGSYVPQTGKVIEFITILPTSDITLQIGLEPGGDEIQPAEKLESGKLAFATVYTNATIYFTGITSDTTIKFYTR
ncbi:hypothetical protein ACE38W_00435 [Chitinophaga sp. Hz27]|uniref:hypothetical protein n=1 Tax=Chitinophaga sp. Hz27 TaxID=3347169 RepID=UPI0035E0517A